MSDVCFGIAGRLFGHNYQPRSTLSDSAAPLKVSGNTTARELAVLLKADKNESYHGDVCSRCGHTVNAPKAAP